MPLTFTHCYVQKIGSNALKNILFTERLGNNLLSIGGKSQLKFGRFTEFRVNPKQIASIPPCNAYGFALF